MSINSKDNPVQFFIVMLVIVAFMAGGLIFCINLLSSASIEYSECRKKGIAPDICLTQDNRND